MTGVVLVWSVVVYMLNIPIVRLYEGYPWQDSSIGAKLQDMNEDTLMTPHSFGLGSAGCAASCGAKNSKSQGASLLAAEQVLPRATQRSVMVFASLSWLFYEAAIDRASEWGTQVKTTPSTCTADRS